MAINEQSNDKTVPAVTGENTAGGEGILGKSTDWQGVHGVSVNQAGVVGDSQNFVGVWGACPKGTGVVGISTDWRGVSGESEKNAGVFGGSKEFVGVWGESPKSAGVVGKSVDWRGVDGQSEKNAGVFGYSKDFAGVWAESKTSEGIHAETWSDSRAAIAAVNQTPNGTGAALYAEKKGSIGHAGYFVGNVHVTQSITVEGDVMLQNGDCAEEFPIQGAEETQAGTVLIIGDDGVALPCSRAYDTRALGVVSGAGGYKPAILLDRKGGDDRRAVALLGKVYCLADAAFGAIRPGDVLTTSPTVGHAMRATDRSQAIGSSIGKALGTLESGRGLIPILAILQ